MKVLIPAAGKGTRLRPHTLYTPKPLLFVAGDSIIGHIFSFLEGLEISEYRVVYSPETSLARSLQEAYPDKNFTFQVQTEALGLGHAVLQGLPDLADEPILILLSDTIIPFDIRSAISSVKKGEGFLVAKEVEDPSRFGVIEMAGDYISNLVEKPSNPESNLAISGIYYLPSAKRLREALEELVKKDIRTRGEYQLTDALSALIKNEEKLKVVTVDTWIDCGTSDALLDANRELLKHNSRVTPVDGSEIRPPCWIADNVEVTNSLIGPNVSIARGAKISNCILSDCIINADSMLEGIVANHGIVGYRAVLKRGRLSLDAGPFSDLEL